MTSQTDKTKRTYSRDWVLLIGLLIALGAFALTQTFLSATSATPPSLASQEALSHWLHLTESQRQAVMEADPQFESQAIAMTQQLRKDRADLAATLRDPQSDNQSLRKHFAQAMLSESQLEKRVAEHVLLIRPVLNPDQQQQLLGLVAEGLEKYAGRHIR